MLPGFDPVSAERRIQALQSAFQAFPPERQPAVLREYLSVQLDRLEAMEDAHQAYLAECVLLAIDNMQDARLQSVEERIAALESPDGPSIAEVLTEAAFVFALTLASLMAVEAVGGLVLLWAGKAASAPLAHKLVVEADEALLKRATDQVAGLGELKAQLEQEAIRRRGLTTVIDALRSGSPGAALWQVGKALLNPIATARSIGEAMSKALAVSSDIETITAKMLLGHLSLAEGLTTSTAARVAYEKALLGDATRPNAVWREFLDNATGGLALAPTYALLQGPWKTVTAAAGTAPPKPVASPFLASTPAGRLLTHVRENRVAAHHQYSLLRAGLAYRPDDGFIGDPLVGQISELVNELAPLVNAYSGLDDSIRPLMVRGYEAALWWAYLQTNGMLDVKPNVQFGDYYDPAIDVGSVVRGYVLTGAGEEAFPSDASFHYWAADFYPGVPLLLEDRAAYLFETFAGPYFELGDNWKALPFAKWYDPARYVGVRALPKRFYGGFAENTDRARRLDEMRLMVILFFTALPGIEDPTSTGLLEEMGKIKGSPVSASKWLELHPRASAPDPPDLAADGTTARAAEAAAPALEALLADAGLLKQQAYETQRSRLLGVVAELRADIAEFKAIASGQLEPDESTRGVDEEGYYQIIEAKKKGLLDLYAEVRTAAELFDPAEAMRLDEEHLGQVERLSAWKPERRPTTVQGSRWKFDPP